MNGIQRPTPSNDGPMCTQAAAMMSIDASQTVANHINAEHQGVGLRGDAARLADTAARADASARLYDALDALSGPAGDASPAARQATDHLESARDARTLNEAARDTAAVLSTLDVAGVDTLAHTVNVMNAPVSVGGVGMVAGFLVHATDTRPVTDSSALNLTNAVTHTAIDAVVDGAFGGAAVAENLLGSAATLMPQGSAAREVLEGAQQVMPTAQVRGGLYALADVQTAGYGAVLDAATGEGPGGLYRSGDAIAESARTGDYGAVAQLLQQSVDVIVPDERGAEIPGSAFRFVADAR